MIGVIGTVPDEDFPLLTGSVAVNHENLIIDGHRIPVNRGTPALLAATAQAGAVIGLDPPTGLLVGDIGLGKGSRDLYAFLVDHFPDNAYTTLCFHYLQPDVDWQYRVLIAAQAMASPPVLIADAGFMYAAKMGGQAEDYTLFTPDVGELAFLADEEAPHPFYTRGFILHEEQKVPELIKRAYQYQNAAKYMLVKGQKDYIVQNGEILDSVEGPSTETLEAIGGTGDTLTGIVTALIESGIQITDAAVLAARVNRLAGQMADPSPASPVSDIIACIPKAMLDVLKNHHIC